MQPLQLAKIHSRFPQINLIFATNYFPRPKAARLDQLLQRDLFAQILPQNLSCQSLWLFFQTILCLLFYHPIRAGLIHFFRHLSITINQKAILSILELFINLCFDQPMLYKLKCLDRLKCAEEPHFHSLFQASSGIIYPRPKLFLYQLHID